MKNIKEKDYNDIIVLNRPVSLKHRPMSMEARAAQFAPFAALTGFEDVIDETAELERQRVAREITTEEIDDI